VRTPWCAGSAMTLSMSVNGLARNCSSSAQWVSTRCRELLPRIVASRRAQSLKGFLAGKTELPGWRHYVRVVGESSTDRTFFAEVYRAAEEAFENTDRAPKETSAWVDRRARGLRVRLVTPGADDTALQEVAALLLLVSDDRVQCGAPGRIGLLNGLETFAERSALTSKLQISAPARKLFAGGLRQLPSEDNGERALTVAVGLQLAEMAPWALEVALNRKNTATARAQALVLLSRVGNRAQLPRLEPLLTDTTVVGTRSIVGKIVQAQVRDLALAATITLNGEKPADFGFLYPKLVPGPHPAPSPSCLGFVNEGERKSAFELWQKRRKK
jgi:hypothetical protein